MFKSLVLDKYAVNTLVSAVFEDDWFDKFELPCNMGGLKRVVMEDVVYIISSKAEDANEILVVSVGSGGVFSTTENRKYIFGRILHVCLSYFDHSVSIPATWKPYHEDSHLSVYAYSSSHGTGERLYVNRIHKGKLDVLYAYAVTDGVIPFDKVAYDQGRLTNVNKYYFDAVLENGCQSQGGNDGKYGVSLTEEIPASFTYGSSLSEWYENKLTSEQRQFVDKDYDGPVRLRGAAGTGKTLAMVVKLLKDAYEKEDSGQQFRFAYLTHSWAVADVVRQIIVSLDERGLWGNWKSVNIFVGSIYDAAQELLSFEFKGLNPISTDGREGRELQYELVSSIVKEKLRNPRFGLDMIAKCNEDLQKYLKDEDRRGKLIYELMNEFACVVDADSVRLGNKKAENYLSAKRESWQMSLPTEADRRLILEIHDAYLCGLREMHVFSIDQMIGDLARYVDSHEWQYVRESKGFDAIFVDELHYFTRVERMALHDLFRKSAKTKDDKLPIFMAYDIKQATNDNFAGMVRSNSASEMVSQTKAGKTSLIELTQVFRYTPEIAEFIADLDGAFPALDLEGEWNNLKLSSQVTSGEKPTLKEYKDNVTMLDGIFACAAREALQKGGRNIAVLSLNEDLFAVYLKAGRVKDKYLPITSREHLPELRYARNKFVFSMPDYVAGMQFDTVYLIHADRVEEDNAESIGEQRRFISRIYLGASRAAKKLVIASSDERRGCALVLNGPIRNKSLITDQS